MLLNFVKVNPSGNTTVFILDPLPRELHPQVALALIDKYNIGCEQVGYLEKASSKDAYRLQMMGGEFCGNATRGLATWIAYRNYPNTNKNEQGQTIVSLEVSGAEGILEVKVCDLEVANKKNAKISMPIPLSIDEYTIDGEIGSFQVVAFEGIVHAVLLNQRPDINKFMLVKKKVEEEKGHLDAIGVMFFDEEKHKMVPVVYVYELDSLVWESSCGSGTAAVGCVIAQKTQNNIDNFKLDQPGGSLTVDILWRDKIKKIYLSGDITVVAEGTVFIDLNVVDSTKYII